MERDSTNPSSCPSRFPYWYALTVFSAISLIAHTTESDTKEWKPEEKWVLSVTIISLILSCISCLAHILKRHKFVGMPSEGLLLFTELGLWLGGLLVMMDIESGIAVNRQGKITNANLYFFSWASFITTIALFTGYGQEASNVDLTLRNALPKAGYWAGICVASLAVLASSSQLFVYGVVILGQEFSCQHGIDQGTLYCERLKFSISLGTISSAIAGSFCFLSNKISSSAHAAASVFTLLAWGFGVAFITFGDKSPGNGVGNLYFSCWAAFILSLFMVSTSMKDRIGELEKGKSSKNDFNDGNPLETGTDAEKGDTTDENEQGEAGDETASGAPNSLISVQDGNMNSTDPSDKVTPQKSNVEIMNEKHENTKFDVPGEV